MRVAVCVSCVCVRAHKRARLHLPYACTCRNYPPSISMGEESCCITRQQDPSLVVEVPTDWMCPLLSSVRLCFRLLLLLLSGAFPCPF